MVPFTGSRSRAWIPVVWFCWPLALALVLTLPLFTRRGHVLARDLVLVPRQPLTDAALGLGDAAPRAVPLDAVTSVLTMVADGGVLARVLVPGAVALAGWGMLWVLRGTGWQVRIAASGLAVWNPFVVERLALGQWVLLVAYGALPWVVALALRHRREGGVAAGGAALAWTALASLTPTGGLLACAGLVTGAGVRSRRAAALLGGGVLLQAPWVVAAVLGNGATSDPVGVAAFAPDTGSATGPVVALLGLGGIWDAAAEPATRTTWVAVVAAAVTCSVLVGGWPWLRDRWGRDVLHRAAVLAAAGLLLAVSTTLPAGQDLMRWAVVEVPGAGLLRDTQKLLAPAVLLVAAALGGVVARVESAARSAPEVRWAKVLALLALPVVLLPDATTVTWPTLTPVPYPDDVRAAVRALDDGPDDRYVVSLPFRSYRGFAWGEGLTSSDPLVRWSSARVVTSDDLQVGGALVRGESPLAAEVGAALVQGPPAETLGRLGVGRVVVYLDDPDAPGVDLTGLRPVLVGEHVAVYDVPDSVAAPRVSSGRRGAVAAAHVVYGGIGAMGAVFWLVRRPRRRSGVR